MTQNISELNLAPISNEKFVDFINLQLPIVNKDLENQIIEEFKIRNLDFRHLYNSKTNDLNIKLPLSLIDGCLFERNIPKPPLVGNFYPIVNRLKSFLINTQELQNKKFKTFDYIFDQLFLTKDLITVISQEDISQLTENDVFICFKNSQQQFPNQEILKIIPSKNYLVTIDKGNYYRGLKSVSIYQNNQIISELNLVNPAI
ncbi:hypothetical protein SAMN05421738_110137 [Algoriella xinjiangensis]|uniref:Uncharacterized protein n=1 Tax=Algoriella xinjiangensis TaxID=684065 RepID=A0A1I4Y670_9FLAO|nr:hypothetical protein [Algoriella xinjiangensis]SFN33505.1 hypothetical protein SAMN05421738_110137 [Algoriella xinjiangensis]VDH15258.1 Uncharacterised protein [Algoriella xinjiangensis]